MVKHCQNCGLQLLIDDSLFCSKCGTKVSDSYPQQKKSEENNQPFNVNEVINAFSDLIHGAFDDLEKLDEITTIKYVIKLFENDLKHNEAYLRKFRTNRIAIIQGIFQELEFDISDNTIEYLYDSLISDMDLHKIPSHSISNYKFDVSVNKDESGAVFYEFMCPVCDETLRFEIAEEYLKDGYDWKLICSNCSYKAEISQSSLKRK